MGGEACTVCWEAASKYKCPTCRIGYCSVKCFKQHKLEPCIVPAATATSAPASTRATQTRERVPFGLAELEAADDEEEKHRLTPADLGRLDDSAPVKELLMNPSIRALLEAVRKDPNPVEAIRALRQRPGFEALAQALIGATGDGSTRV
ncbi:Zinc finger HIT domain-containing protein 3 [Coemansia thaxteri]|nr:Zinc finger HIT domain-containing protein 3 [Coemansia thaxteri]KAJ2469976.1 Zinc finger HIT domain-containing protein 3 [Coemansia sp. RSA 2322]KAJ2481198.1 Zinc finger HIT domain-containing protein 3 [Coemansia sp. RSA 2320]